MHRSILLHLYLFPQLDFMGLPIPLEMVLMALENIAIKKDLSTLSCRRKGCRKCKTQDCMQLITVEEVVEQVENKIKELEMIGNKKWM